MGSPSLSVSIRLNTDGVAGLFDAKKKFTTLSNTWHPAEKHGSGYEILFCGESSYTESNGGSPQATPVSEPFMGDLDLSK